MNLSDQNMDPQQLVDDYFLRELSEQELETLDTALAKDPDLKSQFLRSMYDDLDLYEAIEHIQKEQAMRDRAVFNARRKSARTIRLNRINRIAASLAILSGIGYVVYRAMDQNAEVVEAPIAAESPVMSDQPSAELVAQFDAPHKAPVVAPIEVEPSLPPLPAVRNEIQMVARITDLFVLDGFEVSAINSDEIRQLKTGDLIGLGDLLEIPKGGRLSIEYLSEPTTVSFGEQSTFTLREADGSGQLELREGRMVAHVAKQERGQLFSVLTDDAEFVMHESSMELENNRESILSVITGKVQMIDRKDDRSVLVRAGYYAESDEGVFSRPVEFKKKTIRPEESKTLPRIPWQHRDAGDQYIVVDPGRNLTGHVEFRVPSVRGRISSATLRLRVTRFKTDRGGQGTLRIKKVDRDQMTDLGQYSGQVRAGMDMLFDIDPELLNTGKNELLLEMDKGGDDFWFGSADSEHPPELHLNVLKD